jgi:hypothetical protein
VKEGSIYIEPNLTYTIAIFDFQLAEYTICHDRQAYAARLSQVIRSSEAFLR